MNDLIGSKFQELDNAMFIHNQSIEKCLVVADKILGISEAQEKLEEFVKNYNISVMNKITETRAINADSTKSL